MAEEIEGKKVEEGKTLQVEENPEETRILQTQALKPAFFSDLQTFFKGKRKIAAGIFLAVLVTVFMVLVLKNFFSAPAAGIPVMPSLQSSSSAPLLTTSVAIPVPESARSEPSPSQGMMRSPFSLKPLLPEGLAAKKLILQGTLVGRGEEGYAIVNNKIVKKGDYLDDKTVESIEKDHIVLREESGELIRLEAPSRSS